MSASLATDFDRLLAAPPGKRAGLARDLARRGLEWADWSAQFNRIHEANPEEEATAARDLRAAYRAAGDRLTAARMRMIEARAVHRAGSPREAAATFERAARDLEAAGDARRSVQVRIVRVDALAVSGRVDEALRSAAALRPRLVGAWARPWRQVLDGNVANALRLRGDLEGALQRYDAVARALARLGQGHTAAMTRMNAGVALLDAGLGEAALARFEAAATGFESSGAPDLALEARYNRACALVRAARLGEGVSALERLALEHRERGLERREALCRVDLADALLRAGDAGSARTEAERAAALFASAGAHAERCEALLVAGAAAGLADAAAAARALLARARAAAKASDRPAIVLRCDLLRLDLAPRPTRSALAEVARIARSASSLRQAEIAAQANLLLGEASLQAGRGREARRHFSEAARAAAGRPWIRAAAGSGLASCLAREGRRAAALAAFRRLGDFLDAVRGQLPGPWLRATFVLGRLDPSLARVELLLDRGGPADRREAEALLDALAAQRFFDRAPPRAPRGAFERLRRRLEALYDRIGRGAGPTRGGAGAEVADAVAEAERIERRVAESWRVAERSGRSAPGVSTARPRPSSLGSAEAALHVWVRAGRVNALLRRGRSVVGTADLGSLEALAAEADRLQFLADRVRIFGAEGAAPALRERLEALSSLVLAPVLADSGRSGIRALRLVLDPRVPDLPWESLPVDGVPLCARFDMLRVPCLRARRPAGEPPGTTTFVASGEAALLGVREEARGLVGHATFCVGDQATRQALSEALGSPGVVHVAGHGLSTAEAPALGGVRLADGWYAAADVPARVEVDIVVLAACRTGLEQGLAARAWGGLPAALLSSGARRVVWTASDVDDRAAAEATIRFHHALKGATCERAFGRALLEAGGDARVAACLLPFRLSGVLP